MTTGGEAEVLLADVAALGFVEVARSTLGRPIVLGRFGPPAADKRVLVLGGMHGNEPASVRAAIDLCARLRARPPEVAVLVLPCANPDGTAADRKNTARDVDLNRNFAAANFSVGPRPGDNPGERPLSEPEAQIIAAIVERERPTHVVSVHAPLACVNHDGPAATWAAAVSAASGWPVRQDIGYPTPGSLGSWLGRDRGLPVLTIELPPGAWREFRDEAAAALDAAVACC